MRAIAGQADGERILRTREILSDVCGWPPLICLPASAVFLVPQQWPRWGFMWGLAGSIYCGCKWLTWRRTRVADIPWWRHAGYLLAWPGMDAAAFLTPSSTAPPTCREWCVAGVTTAMGLVLFFAGAAYVSTGHPYLLGWIGVVGTGRTRPSGISRIGFSSDR